MKKMKFIKLLSRDHSVKQKLYKQFSIKKILKNSQSL